MPKQNTRIVTGAAALVAGGSLAIAGFSLANANNADATSPTNLPDAAVGYDAPQGGATGYGQPGERGDGGGRQMHAHTQVTGDELAKVTDAVKAKDSAITVTSVQKDPDGSYDVLGTKAGAQVRVEVSADLQTIELGGGGPGKAGRQMHAHTAVTGDEAAKVTAAVKAKDSAVTVTTVQQDPDGSYDVLGTKAGAPVMVEVSKDLKSVEVRTGGPGGMGGHGRLGDGQARQGQTQQDQAQQGQTPAPTTQGAAYTGAV